MTPPPGCRAFEARLLALRDGEPVPVGHAHPAECAPCRTLVLDLAANEALVSSLASPEPAPHLAARLSEIARDLPERALVRDVLGLLQPGVLAVPVASPALASRLAAIGQRPRGAASALAAETPRPVEKVGFFAWLFGDWRLTVAAAYATVLIAVTVLGIDPLSVARRSATGLTAAGERAIADARAVAAARLEGVLSGAAKKPLHETLDYRIYRTVAIGKARTAAWAEIFLQQVFGSASAPEAEARPSPAPESREPKGVGLRS